MKTNYIFKARWLQGAASANESKKMQVNPRITPFRFACTLLLFLTLNIGNAWGAIASGTYELVTSASGLVAGEHYIIASGTSGTVYCIDNTSNANNRKTVSATVSNSQITVAANSTILTFTLGGSSRAWTFTTDNYLGTAGKLAATSSSNNRLGIVASPGNNGKWAITFTGSYVAKFVAQGSYTRKYIQYNYNSGTPIFNGYSSEGTPSTYIYRQQSCTPPTTALSITSSSSATVGTPLTLTTTGGNAGSITWSVENGTGTATLDGSTLTPTGAGTVTVTATQGVNAGKCGASPTQTITITRAAATITLSEAGGTSSVSGTYYAGDSYTLPSSTEASCGSKVLVGWSTVTVAETNTKPSSNYYDKGTSVSLSAGENKFYAVFATASGGGATPGSKTLVSNSSSTYYASGYITGSGDASSATWTADAFTMTQNKNSGSNISLTYAEIRAYQYHSLVFTPTSGTTITSIVVTANSNAYATALGGSSISNCTKSVSSSTVTITPTDGTAAITLVQAAQSRLNKIVVNYTTGGTSYSAYSTSCCTPLGSINGSVNLTQTGTSVTIKNWGYTQGSGAAESNVNKYTVYLYSSANSYASSIANADCTVANRASTGVTFNDLTYGTTYKIKIAATGNTGYCGIAETTVGTINSTSTETFQLACDVPTNVTATSVTASSATVSWDDVATNYQYVLDQSSSDPAGAGTAVNGAHSVNLSVSASTNYYFHVRTNCGNSVFSSWATISFSTPAAACTGYSFHDGTDGSNPSDWQINCFTYSGNSDRQWLKDFTIRNKSHYYVGYQGNFYNDNLGNSNAKSYTNQMQYMQLALDRTHGSNNQLGSNYAGVQGTLLCYDNSSADNLYVDFLPDGYYFILDAAGTPTALEMTCTNPDMTAANILSNNSVWETSIQTITYVNKKYTVGIKANSAIAGKTWQTTRYNTNEDMTTLKKRNSSGGFTGTLAAADVTAGTRGKYRIWADNFSTSAGEKNWYAHFVPYYRVTYNGNGASGSVAASADKSCEGDAAARTVKAAANGFDVPAHTTFGGWATSASGAKVYDPNDDIVLTGDVELFAIWTPEANASITLNNYTGSPAPTNLYAGDSWNLPSTNTYTCGDKTFVGWSTVTVASTDTKPTSNFYEPGASVTLAASNTFYAVFANGGSNDYELVTSASTALAAGDEIIFASSGSAGNAKAMGKKNDNNRSSVDVTIADGGVIEDPTLATSTDNTTDIYPFVLETNGSDFAIKDVLHNQYLTANGAGTSGNNYLRTNDGPASATTQKFTISVDAEGAATITGHNDAANARNNMRYNGSNNPPIFSCYSSGQSPIYIYRKPPTTGYSTTCVACETVTVGYTASPTGGTVGVKKGATSIAPNGTVNVCGATVALTVTLTPATHYDITGFTATGLTTGTATITPAVGSTLPVSAEQEFTVTLSANATGTVTLTPTFTEDAYRTVVFKSNGSALFNDGGSATTFDGTNKWKQKVYLEAKPVWPTDLAAGQACDGSSTSFRGWVAAGQTWSGKKDAVPAGSTLITDASGFAAAASGSGDVVYHAVWAEASGSGTPHYAKVTSTGDITNGDYLIVYETGNVAFDGSLTTIDVSGNKISVTISTEQITANSTVNASKFTIDVANKYIKSASNKYINKDTYANGLAGNDAATSVHSMSIDGSGNFVVEGTGEDGGNYVTLRYNTSDNRFRFYKTGQEAVQLYKYDAGATYSNYLTTCCENYAVTLTGSGVVGGGTFSASSMQPCVGSTVELSATLCSGYTQGAWTVAKTGTPATTVTVTNNQFTMPSYAVTVSLATTAKVDHFIDRMHSTDGYTGDGAERSGCNYTVPNLSNTSEPVGSNCDETHYIFVGWVDADHVGSNGALLSGYSIISGNSTQNATGTTYYAIWAQAL